VESGWDLVQGYKGVYIRCIYKRNAYQSWVQTSSDIPSPEALDGVGGVASASGVGSVNSEATDIERERERERERESELEHVAHRPRHTRHDRDLMLRCRVLSAPRATHERASAHTKVVGPVAARPRTRRAEERERNPRAHHVPTPAL
jgi:hypothetical protein